MGGGRTVQYIGIASDEKSRIKRHTTENKLLPLVEIGWTESDCRKWCEENDLLSPIYKTESRSGCWFCNNQKVGALKRLRKNHPELWGMLLKWDIDSPFAFRPDLHTVHDFDKRFRYEELGLVPSDRKFRWKMLEVSEEDNEEIRSSVQGKQE